MAEYTPLEQWLYDTGVAMPGNVRRIARKIEASEWLAARDKGVAASAWLEGHSAGRDYQGYGWNSDAHDPDRDNPYRTDCEMGLVEKPMTAYAFGELVEEYCAREDNELGERALWHVPPPWRTWYSFREMGA